MANARSLSLSNPLDFQTITNLYLYGQKTAPTIYNNRIRPADSPTIVVNIDESFWTGPGRYAMPVLAPFVNTFFSDIGSLPTGVQQLYAGRFAAQGNVGPVKITVADLELFGGVSASQFHFSFGQYGFGLNDSDYAARTYIYNNEGFSISPSTVFVFDPLNDNSHIENLTIHADPDNFDFDTSGLAAQFADSVVLKNQIDPYGMGSQLLLSVPDSPVVASYGMAAFQSDRSVAQTYSSGLTTLATSALPAMLDIVSSLKGSGTIDYSADGIPIVYGTSGNDTASYFQNALPSGASSFIGIGGPGDDQINGLSGVDSLVGGTGNDTLRGNAGNDFIDGSAGIDTALFDDRNGGAIELSSGGAAPSDPGLTPTDVAPFLTIKRGGEIDVLHSIEKLVLSSGADTLTVAAGTDLTSLQEIDAAANPNGTEDTLDLSQMHDGYSILNGELIGNAGGVDVKLLNFEKIIGLSGDNNIKLGAGTIRDIITGAGNDTELR